jgi:hypothetical protein
MCTLYSASTRDMLQIFPAFAPRFGNRIVGLQP